MHIDMNQQPQAREVFWEIFKKRHCIESFSFNILNNTAHEYNDHEHELID